MTNIDIINFPNLQPSSELITHYRKAITKFEQDFNEINNHLLKFEEISSHNKCEEERERLLKDLLELRNTLSDVNVYVHSERQQVYKLTCEKEILEVDNLLHQRKLEVILDFIDVSEEELEIFLRNSKGKQVLRQRCRIKIKNIKEKLSRFPEKSKSVEEFALEKQLECLRKLFQESKISWENEKISLFEDRDVCKQELGTFTAQNERHVRLIDARLNSAQESLLSANKKIVRMKRDSHLIEQKWLAERDKVASNVRKNLAYLDGNLEAMDRSSFTDLSDINQICKVQLKREVTALKKQLKKEEEMSSLHEEKCLKAQQEVCKLKEQNSVIMASFKTKAKKMQERIHLQEKQKEKLINWKSKQHEGFLTDIKLLRQQIKVVIHQLFKLTTHCNRNGIDLDSEALEEVKSVASLVRKVHHSILASRKQLMKLDNGPDAINAPRI